MTSCFTAACFTVLGGCLAAGCTWARRATLDAVDPQLRAKGERLDRVDGADRQQGFALGAYEVSAPTLRRQSEQSEGLLPPDPNPRPIVQHRLQLRVSAHGADWPVDCTSQRRPPTSMDYAAALGENRDEIAVKCTVGEWAFRTEAELSHNFAGRLTHHESARALTLDVVVWVERFGKLRRHLPDPVAQVRDGSKTVAAMVLGKPETAWISAGIEPGVEHAALSTMLALRFLPLGLEG